MVLATLVYPTVRSALLKREKLYSQRTHGKFVTNHNSIWRTRERMPVDWYGDGEILMFEEMPVRVPKEYDKWLTQVYGNYRILPPPEKRVTHHYTELIDMERSYVAFQKQK